MHTAVEESALASLIPGALQVVEGSAAVPFKPGVHGWEVTDIRIIFDACSGPAMPCEFRDETPYALRQAVRNAGTQILEPIYYYEVIVQAELCGKTISEIVNHHGSVASIEENGVYVKLSGKLPARMYQEFLHIFQTLTKNMGIFDILRIEYEPYNGK